MYRHDARSLERTRRWTLRRALRSVQFSYYINNRQPNGSLSNVLSRLAVGVRVVGDDVTELN